MYEKLNFRTGQVLAADDLNHMEEGIAAAGKLLAITWKELKKLREEKSLKAGAFYRITDYVTTTAQAKTSSAGHQFDVVVLAIFDNVLSEKAYAVLHEGDTYFSEAGANLAAWQIWYSLDNDAERFAWADKNGKGVIYRMIDEWGNDLPYDFKNIMHEDVMGFEYFQWGQAYYFERNKFIDKVIGGVQYYGYSTNRTPASWSSADCFITEESPSLTISLYNQDGSSISFGGEIRAFVPREKTYYTFANASDINGSSHHNVVKGNGINKVVFGEGNGYNTIGSDSSNNTIGSDSSNNTIGNGCSNNTIGNGCSNNTIDNGCSSNTIGSDSSNNTIGNGCSNNTIDNGCSSNTIGNGCSNNRVSQNGGYVLNYCTSASLIADMQIASFNSNYEVKVFNLADLADLLNK